MKRLEIGPKPHRRRRSGWDTLDCQPGSTFRLRWGYEPLPFNSGAYDLVFASHVLEHIPWFRAADAIAEVHRILCVGGTFEVWVPDFSKIVRAYFDGSILDDGWLPLNAERDPWKSLNARLFWGARRGEVGQEQHYHRACYDEVSLRRLLSSAGFQSVRAATRPRGEGHGWVDLGMIATKACLPRSEE